MYLTPHFLQPALRKTGWNSASLPCPQIHHQAFDWAVQLQPRTFSGPRRELPHPSDLNPNLSLSRLTFHSSSCFIPPVWVITYVD